MPLSEHEERILKEIERQLAADDPRFVARARRSRAGLSRSLRLRLAIALGVVGVVLVLSIAFAPLIVPAIGMALIFGAILLGVTAVKERSEPEQEPVPPDELG